MSLLLETGDQLLLESGDRLLLESDPAPGGPTDWLLLTTGDPLLLESGDYLALTTYTPAAPHVLAPASRTFTPDVEDRTLSITRQR